MTDFRPPDFRKGYYRIVVARPGVKQPHTPPWDTLLEMFEMLEEYGGVPAYSADERHKFIYRLSDMMMRLGTGRCIWVRSGRGWPKCETERWRYGISPFRALAAYSKEAGWCSVADGLCNRTASQARKWKTFETALVGDVSTGLLKSATVKPLP